MILRDAELARQTVMLAKMIARQNSLIAGAVDAQMRIAARIAYGARAQPTGPAGPVSIQAFA